MAVDPLRPARPASPVLPYVLPLDDPAATLDAVGGKGSALAELARGGLPVPGGFHVTTDAYREFVTAAGIDERIEAVLAGLAGADDADRAEAAGARIRGFFRGAELPKHLAKEVGSAYEAVGGGRAVMAVRSSATAEDLPGLSFAGQQDTYLNVQGTEAVLAAVRNCWASLWTGRALHYRARNHIPHQDVRLAVVVQELVDADAAGVLFTVDPTTGRTDRLLINAAWGLGEAVVSGLVTPDTVLVDRASGAVVEERVADKTVMTVRTEEGGTHEAPVPQDRRRTAVLSAAEAARLARHGQDAEDLYGDPRDIEWARRDGTFYILQARPITTTAPTPVPEEWNDSLGTDSLWTSANLGEAVPDVMTPAAWSFIQAFMGDVMVGATLDGRPMYGNIGGRFYMNLSVTATLAAAFGQSKKFRKANELVFGRLPDKVTVPLLPASRLRVVRDTLGEAIRVTRRVRANGRLLDDFLTTAPDRCTDLRERTSGTQHPSSLRELYDTEIAPYFRLCCHMLQAATRQDGDMLVEVRGSLRDLAGETDADLMTTGLTADGGQLASMGPLLGLEQLAAGTIGRDTYLRRYGHRSPHEFEISRPRPAEDPHWIDAQLAALGRVEENAALRLGRQDKARTAAWTRFEAAHPKQAAPMRAAVRKWSQAARLREAARTEIARVFWLLRTFVVRAGELTGDGEELFFLHTDEIRAVLDGERAPLAAVPARRAAYEGYSALPPYPTLVRGEFDPARWAADPDRRADFHDAHAHSAAPADPSDTVTGSPASGGVVEGTARVIATVEEGDLLQSGEILVTTVTNIGWTPLFTRISAIVTDVGANLSHASIVARELGIPAVVGCGNATTRIRTGDRVRVDGGRGTVEIVRR
ncbi:PEP/pyruvate-binding domain-containing protein [Streptomyces sp. NPDC021093]|uniref:PEP/pyruvate-binding domain-containing protein n=1 Tax=Streptomyces sp. NPDC021093 TaxID=3365112 RepID=UPI00379B17F2